MDVADHHHHMGLALAAAERARALGEVPVGAILTANGEVLAIGGNRRETTQRTAAHAEMEAIEAFNARFRTWRLPPGTALYVTVEPCLMCLGALLWARCESIYFGCYDPRGEGLRGLQSHLGRFSAIAGGIREAECSAQLKDFFAARRAAKKTSPTESGFPNLLN